MQTNIQKIIYAASDNWLYNIGELSTADQQQPISDDDESLNQHKMRNGVVGNIASTTVTGDSMIDVNCPNYDDNNVVMQEGVDNVG